MIDHLSDDEFEKELIERESENKSDHFVVTDGNVPLSISKE
jgi:hypothetical protein